MTLSQPLSNITVGAELEFYLFDKDGNIIADLESGKYPTKRYDIKSEFADVIQKFSEELAEYEIEAEDGPGQLEAHFKPHKLGSILANNINKFKELALEISAKHKLAISFDAKPLKEHPGSSIHIHLCADEFDPYGLKANGGSMAAKNHADNEMLKWAIGGCLHKMNEGAGLFAPDEESKRRYVPWQNAPTKICWGKNNRSVAVRVPDSKPKRLEHRAACANADPEKLIEHVIMAASYGVENRADPGEPVYGNAWDEKYDREWLI